MENEVLMYLHNHPQSKLKPMEQYFNGKIPEYGIIQVLAKYSASAWVYRNPKMECSITRDYEKYFWNWPKGLENKPVQHKEYLDKGGK